MRYVRVVRRGLERQGEPAWHVERNANPAQHAILMMIFDGMWVG